MITVQLFVLITVSAAWNIKIPHCMLEDFCQGKTPASTVWINKCKSFDRFLGIRNILYHSAIRRVAKCCKVLLKHMTTEATEVTVLSSSFSLPLSHLAQNPFMCDCHLKWLADYLFDNPIETSGARCSHPRRLANKRISQVKGKKFRCTGRRWVHTDTTRHKQTCNSRWNKNHTKYLENHHSHLSLISAL